MGNHFILTPFFLDQPVPGLGPLADAAWTVNEPDLSAGNPQQRMTALYRPLAAAVAGGVRQGERPVSIAGDCCTTIAVLAGLEQAGVWPTLIWFDAHGDFNTWETSPSGFLGGMPLAMLVGRGEQTMVTGLGLTPLPENRVILTDGRDLDPEEAIAVRRSQLVHLPQVADLLTYPLPPGPLYVHLDTDVIPPSVAPAMNYPTPGGPSLETLRSVLRRLHESGRVTAVSVSTWNPALDKDGASRRVTMELLDVLLDG